ncbi:MAG: hypothetical protein QOH01_917 [Verrucomicrobiota bacterium]|jgi:hypothetical protein
MLFLRTAGILVMVLASACRPHHGSKKYEKEFNVERAKRQIHGIPEDAVRFNPLNEATPTWVQAENAKEPVTPRWQSKVLEIRDGILLQETDDFASGKKYIFSGNELLAEELFVRYSYAAEREGKNPWWCYVTSGPNQGERTIAEARRILEDWAVGYPQ